MRLMEIVDQKVLHMPIGPSGAGKSTLFRELKQQDPSLQPFSLDLLRHEFYDPNDYSRAWKMSTEDKQFSNRANQRFVEMVKSGQNLFVDNTNLTPKRRKFYLQQAKKHGYKTVAHVFSNVDLDTLIQRQETRSDKTVPEEAVRRQFQAMKEPYEGEFDEVNIVE